MILELVVSSETYPMFIYFCCSWIMNWHLHFTRTPHYTWIMNKCVLVKRLFLISWIVNVASTACNLELGKFGDLNRIKYNLLHSTPAVRPGEISIPLRALQPIFYSTGTEKIALRCVEQVWTAKPSISFITYWCLDLNRIHFLCTLYDDIKNSLQRCSSWSKKFSSGYEMNVAIVFAGLCITGSSSSTARREKSITLFLERIKYKSMNGRISLQ